LPHPDMIAIDGPAAAGKSTVGELLAKELDYLYFDTGVMYRAVTWAALQRGISIADQEKVSELAQQVRIDITQPTVQDGRQYTVSVDGQDVTWDLRRPEVDYNVSPVSAYPGVRAALTEQQRRIGQQGKVVMAGRDIGTVVLPEAPLKIYLDATVEARARRRHLESAQRDEERQYAEILRDMRRRDAIDSGRDAAPLRPAADAVIIDTTNLTIAQVMQRIRQLVEERTAPMSFKRGLLVGIMRGLLRLFTRYEVSGQENFPAGGPLLVVFNHIAHLDGLLVVANMPLEVEAITLSDLYDLPVAGHLLRLYGTIPVHRDAYDREVLRLAFGVLAEGKVLALAPEARISPSCTMERGRRGAAYLALRSGAPLLPIGLTGTETVLTDLPRLRRPHLTVNIGAPFHLQGPLARGAERRAQLEAGRDEIMRRIAALLPEKYRGVYA
jgi:cytidylate kinase